MSIEADTIDIKIRAEASTVAPVTKKVADDIGGLTRNVGSLGRELAKVGGEFGALGSVVSRVATGLGTAGLAGALIGVVTAVPMVVDWIRKTREEQERLEETASRLKMPVAELNRYGDGMRDLAMHLRDAAAGLDVLTEAELRNFQLLGVSAREYSTAAEQALQKIWVSRGTDLEKIDAWRKLTGDSYEQAKKALEDYEKVMNRVVGNDRRGNLTRYSDTLGLEKNSGQSTASLGLVSQSELSAQQRAKKELVDMYKDIAADQQKVDREAAREAQERAREQARIERETQANAERATRSKLAYTREIIAENNRMFSELMAGELQSINARTALDMQGLNERIDIVRREADFGDISRAQELVDLQELERQKFEVQARALQDRASLHDKESIDYRRLMDDLELMTQEHHARMREFDARSAAERAQPWRTLFGSMQQGLTGVLQSAFRGYMSIGGVLRGIAGAILDSFTDMAAGIVAKWAMLKIASLIFNKTAIAGEAAKAGAGGVASMAAAPFPLNLTAPGFGAAMAALAASYLAVPAAANGFDIPAGINPLTQLHEKEMVLPAKHADVIRGLAENGSGAQAGATVELKVMRAGPGEVLVRERDLVAVLKKLAGQNYR